MYADAPISHEPYSTSAPVNAGVLAVSQVVTSALGSVTERFTYTMTGQVVTSQLGNESVRFTYRVSGNQASFVGGMTSVLSTYHPTGQVINAVLGNETVLFGAVIYPTSNVMVGILNSPRIEARYTVTGLTMQALLGNELIWSPVDDAANTIWKPVIVK